MESTNNGTGFNALSSAVYRDVTEAWMSFTSDVTTDDRSDVNTTTSSAVNVDSLDDVHNPAAYALITLVVLTVVGNGVFALLVKYDVHLQHMMYWFMTSLACMNILMALTVMPMGIAVALHGESSLIIL